MQQMAAPAPRPADLFAVAPAPRLDPATQPDSEPQHFLMPHSTEEHVQADREQQQQRRRRQQQQQQQQQQRQPHRVQANTEVVIRPPSGGKVTPLSSLPSLHEPQADIKGTRTEEPAALHEGGTTAAEEAEVEPAEFAQAMVETAVQMEAADVAAIDPHEILCKQLVASEPANQPAVKTDNVAAAAMEAETVATLVPAAASLAEASARTAAEQEMQQDEDFEDAEEELREGAAEDGGDAPVPG